MRSPSACDRFLAAAALAAVVATSTSSARADDKQICSDAYASTQTLRKEGKIQAAHDAALACVKDTCPEFIRADCATWLGEVDASQPSIVLDVRDRAGNPVLKGTVTLDGAPWLATIDLQSHAIDPGTHTLRVASESGATVDQEVVIREGEKNVKVSATLPIGEAPPGGPLAPTAAPSEEGEGERSIVPWIVGGAGVGLAAVGGVLAIVVAGEKSTFDENCDETCNKEGDDARTRGETLGPVSTVFLLAGVAAVGVGVTLFVLEEPAEAGSAALRVTTGPVARAGGASWRVEGSF